MNAIATTPAVIPPSLPPSPPPLRDWLWLIGTVCLRSFGTSLSLNCPRIRCQGEKHNMLVCSYSFIIINFFPVFLYVGLISCSTCERSGHTLKSSHTSSGSPLTHTHTHTPSHPPSRPPSSVETWRRPASPSTPYSSSMPESPPTHRDSACTMQSGRAFSCLTSTAPNMYNYTTHDCVYISTMHCVIQLKSSVYESYIRICI